jgi:hypothetical protein
VARSPSELRRIDRQQSCSDDGQMTFALTILGARFIRKQERYAGRYGAMGGPFNSSAARPKTCPPHGLAGAAFAR